VPLPLEEVALSWSALADKKDKITKDSSLGRPREEKQKILLTAVPTIVIDNYVKMFQMAADRTAGFGNRGAGA
jgi:hypothetical protein